MRIVLVAWLICLMFLSNSCLKKDNGCSVKVDDTAAPLAEQQTLKKYLDSAGLSATLDPRGFYFSIIDQGSGASPGPCSQVTVSYKGSLTSGTQFDEQPKFVTTLNRLIDGWQEGILLIKKTGQIMLYLPPSLGYGSSGNSSIPPNSILIFDIVLIDVQ